jgi:hypothetical protein
MGNPDIVGIAYEVAPSIGGCVLAFVKLVASFVFVGFVMFGYYKLMKSI